MNEIIKYSDGEIELEVSIDNETIWLIAEDIASLFDVQRPAVVKHIGNIYKDEELNQISTCSILEQVTKDGKSRKVNYYNLDVVISVGYRVNSKKATKFRQWAISVLKEYISNGYVLNTHKITEQRLVNLENDMHEVKNITKFHDRFLIIDSKDVYHIGASLKDLGNKTFAFSKMDIDSFEFLEKLK